MGDVGAVERWVRGYVQAWSTDDPEDIAALFAEDARYVYHPFEEPWAPRDRIVDEWIANGDSDTEWRFEYEVLEEKPELGIVKGVTTYVEGDGPDKVYANLWLIRLDEDGRAVEFAEWWMKKRS
jgi:ketosteroid isomerase-like protein